MVSKSIIVGVGIPMIIVGALMAWLWSPMGGELQSQVELIGSTIGILGSLFLDYFTQKNRKLYRLNSLNK
jgi:hypothetical protein